VNALDQLVSAFSKLPGIGKKSAARIAYYLLRADRAFVEEFASQLLSLRDKIRFCSRCGAYSEEECCPVCSDPNRDHSIMCVVEQPQDVLTIEATHEYSGVYHVLNGVISPLDGIGPEKLRIGSLMERVRNEGTAEVILATNPTVEGDTTALYLQRLLKAQGVKASRLASGLPVGGDLEYADRLTLSRSLRGRIQY
jgi:recombination protein RecR